MTLPYQCGRFLPPPILRLHFLPLFRHVPAAGLPDAPPPVNIYWWRSFQEPWHFVTFPLRRLLNSSQSSRTTRNIFLAVSKIARTFRSKGSSDPRYLDCPPYRMLCQDLLSRSFCSPRDIVGLKRTFSRASFLDSRIIQMTCGLQHLIHVYGDEGLRVRRTPL